jgi:hypothetical protein
MAVIAEKSVVIKQSRGFNTSVGTVVFIFFDKSLCLLCGTTSSVTKDLKEVFKFVACIFSGIIISTVFIRRGRRRRKLLGDLKEKKRILSFEGGSSGSHYVGSSLWKRLWTCRKTDY